jgi:L-ascorbate metabolism protein UlaG (beta-lactamase superfamily)
MKIKWNGHASFTITASNGTVIVSDPYEPGCFGGGIGYSAVDDRADVVLVSHDHADHNFVKSLKGSPAVLRKSGSVKGIEFVSVEAAHDDKAGKERGANTLFVFTVDGIRIGFMGDLGHILSPQQLKALGPIDLLLLPVGGVFTVDPQAASKLIDQIKPRLVIPMHYKTPKCGFPLASVDDFAKTQTRVKKTGQSELQLSPTDLPAAGPEVWIMDFAR